MQIIAASSFPLLLVASHFFTQRWIGEDPDLSMQGRGGPPPSPVHCRVTLRHRLLCPPLRKGTVLKTLIHLEHTQHPKAFARRSSLLDSGGELGLEPSPSSHHSTCLPSNLLLMCPRHQRRLELEVYLFLGEVTRGWALSSSSGMTTVVYASHTQGQPSNAVVSLS